MAEDIRTYTFDFEPEAEGLLTGLGRKGKRILIAETEVTYPAGYIGAAKVDVPLVVGRTGLGEHRAAGIREHITYTYNKRPYLGSYEKAVVPLFSHKYFYISLRKNSNFIRHLGSENKHLLQLFVLYHEAGHALISPRRDTGGSPVGECAADAYAVLRLLQRFGAEAVPFLSMVSWLRAHHAVNSGFTEHLTTPVLDKIIMDSTREDFSVLTPDETIMRAKEYGHTFAPDALALSKAREVFQQAQIDSLNITDFMASTCLSSQLEDFGFYIFAKSTHPFLLHPGELVYNEKPWKPSSLQQLEQVRSAVAERLSGMCLSDVFNSTALTAEEKDMPLSVIIKATRPSWQKQFVYER